MNSEELIETPDRWLLQIDGSTVVQCCVDFAFTLVLDPVDSPFVVLIEQPMLLRSSAEDEGVELIPGKDPMAVVPALKLLHQEVHRAEARKDGQLKLWFTDGHELSVAASKKYEAWTLDGPRGFRVVCLPGGDLAIWASEEQEV